MDVVDDSLPEIDTLEEMEQELELQNYLDQVEVQELPNEQALDRLFSLAKGDGYTKDVEEFKTLVGFNAEPVKK